MKALVAIIVVSILVAAVFASTAGLALAQPIFVKKAIENNLKMFPPIKGLAKLAHISIIDKQIRVGSNWVAFNPNVGNAKVVTMIGNK